MITSIVNISEPMEEVKFRFIYLFLEVKKLSDVDLFSICGDLQTDFVSTSEYTYINYIFSVVKKAVYNLG